MTEKRIMCFGDSLTWGWVPVIEARKNEFSTKHLYSKDEFSKKYQ